MWAESGKTGHIFPCEEIESVSGMSHPKPQRRAWARGALYIVTALLMGQVALPEPAHAQEPQASKLFQTGQVLAEKTHYLEALDLLYEAREITEASDRQQTGLYAEILYALAQTKIRGRLHQQFPAHYVKTALEDVQTANKVRELIPGMLPQKLAEGYFLEGFIQKKFFLRRNEARACLEKAKNLDPGSAAVRRELFDLEATADSKGD